MRQLTGPILQALAAILRRAAAALIRRSTLFDADWYRAHNPDVAAGRVDPALHYLVFGGFEGRDPGPDFSNRWYLEAYGDVIGAGINPLLHYLRHGKAEGRAPAPPPPDHPRADSVRTEPIIVFQMGKVGSTTVQLSLISAFKSVGLEVPVYDLHHLSNIELQERELILQAKQGQHVADTLQAIRRAMEVKAAIRQNPDQQWNLVTLVREPVARAVSAFFQVLPELIPDWQFLFATGDLSVSDLWDLFTKSFMRQGAGGRWFDQEMRPMFGIDVYASPFPTTAGYKIYSPNRTARLLLIRLEDLDRVAAPAFEEFLGLRNFKLAISNLTSDKAYSELYGQFLSRPLPSTYVERMYRTKYAEHFYTREELCLFAGRWTHGQLTSI